MKKRPGPPPVHLSYPSGDPCCVEFSAVYTPRDVAIARLEERTKVLADGTCRHCIRIVTARPQLANAIAHGWSAAS